MSTSFDIIFVFDVKQLKNLDKILSWISDHSGPGFKVEVKFSDNVIKKFNFSHDFKDAKLDFSKGVPDDCNFDLDFTVKKDSNLINNLLEEGWSREDLEVLGKNCKPKYIGLGMFYLHIHDRGGDKFELHFHAATFKLGSVFMNSHSSRNLLLDFCKKFDPKEAYTEIEDVKDEVFWPPRRSKR